MKVQIMNTIGEIERIENIDPRNSKKYVPIYTSQLIKILEPEYKLVYAQKLFNATSAHFAVLTDGKNEIKIYNSYDRSLAFRMTLNVEDNFNIDLGMNRIVHIGQNAKDIQENVQLNKQDILDSIDNKKVIINALRGIKIDKELARIISDIIFKSVSQKKGFQGYTNYVDILIGKVDIIGYINQSIQKFIDGDYTITVNGKKSNGRKKSSVLVKAHIEIGIVKALINQFPEYFI